MNRLINLSNTIPTPAPSLTVAYTPIRLEIPARQPLELRLTAPTLVVCGAEDAPHFTPRGPEWHADAFRDAPGADALLTINGVDHGLGGIAGLDAKETEVEDPDALEATRRITLAWLRRIFDVEQDTWIQSQTALQGSASAIAKTTVR